MLIRTNYKFIIIIKGVINNKLTSLTLTHLPTHNIPTILPPPPPPSPPTPHHTPFLPGVA